MPSSVWRDWICCWIQLFHQTAHDSWCLHWNCEPRERMSAVLWTAFHCFKRGSIRPGIPQAGPSCRVLSQSHLQLHSVAMASDRLYTLGFLHEYISFKTWHPYQQNAYQLAPQGPSRAEHISLRDDQWWSPEWCCWAISRKQVVVERAASMLGEVVSAIIYDGDSNFEQFIFLQN